MQNLKIFNMENFQQYRKSTLLVRTIFMLNMMFITLFTIIILATSSELFSDDYGKVFSILGVILLMYAVIIVAIKIVFSRFTILRDGQIYSYYEDESGCLWRINIFVLNIVNGYNFLPKTQSKNKFYKNLKEEDMLVCIQEFLKDYKYNNVHVNELFSMREVKYLIRMGYIPNSHKSRLICMRMRYPQMLKDNDTYWQISYQNDDGIHEMKLPKIYKGLQMSDQPLKFTSLKQQFIFLLVFGGILGILIWILSVMVLSAS